MLNAIQMGILTSSTKERLEDLEEQRKELQARIAEERLAKPKMKEEFVRFWLLRFRKLDMSQQEQRQTLVDKAKWSDTQEYKDYEKKVAARSDLKSDEIASRLMTIFAEIGTLRQLSPSAKEVQKKIADLQKFITDNYYVCTDETLDGLGRIYVDDERFKKNIDKAGGDGTAEFVRESISVFCAH